MSRFIDSLKRLHKAGKVTEEKLKEMLAEGKITEGELNYIMA